MIDWLHLHHRGFDPRLILHKPKEHDVLVGWPQPNIRQNGNSSADLGKRVPLKPPRVFLPVQRAPVGPGFTG